MFGAIPVGVHAQHTEVGATLCDSQPPVLTLYSPSDGVTVNTDTITIQGLADRTSSVTVSVNTNTIATEAIQFTGPFSIEVQLAEGTNTIDIGAYLACNATNSLVTLTVQYVPPPEPPQPPGPSDNDGRAKGGGDKKGVSSWIQSILNTINDNLSGGEDKDNNGGGAKQHSNNQSENTDTPISYVRIVRSWLSLLLAVLMLTVVMLPKRYYQAVDSLKQKKSRIVLRATAFILFLLFMFMLLL